MGVTRIHCVSADSEMDVLYPPPGRGGHLLRTDYAVQTVGTEEHEIIAAQRLERDIDLDLLLHAERLEDDTAVGAALGILGADGAGVDHVLDE